MAQFYLINVVSVVGNKFLPGALIDSAVIDTAPLTNAGAELWPAADPIVAAAALKAQAAHRYKGLNEFELTEMMQVAVNQSAAQTFAVMGQRVARGVVTANVADLTAFTVAGNDGLTYTAGQRVLLVAQTTALQNGIYVVGTVAGGTAPLTRATDMPAGAPIVNGMTVEISEGTKWVASTWKAFCTGSCVVNVDDPVFYPRVDKGHGPLVSGTPSVLAVTALFVSAAAEVTAINQTTAANAVKAVQAVGASRGAGTLTITGPNTLTDTISYSVINF